MSLLFFDGFDHSAYGEAGYKWEWDSGGTFVAGRTGNCISNGYCAKYFVPAAGEVIVGFATSTGLTCEWCHPLSYDTGVQCYLATTAYGALRVTNGNGTVLAESAAGVFRFGAWNYIEAKILVHASAGTITVKCNGATVITATGKDTQNQSTADVGWIRFAFPGETLDDVYICDTGGAQNNDFLGEVRVVTLLPQTDAVGGAGANTDFTPSTGTDHGALVDEATPNSDTDYLYSSTLNHADSWNYPALGYTGTIKGVRLNLFAKKADSGTRAIAALTRPASTNRLGDDNYLTTSYTYWSQQWELNPEDSAAWEVADVNGAQFGVKITV